MPHGEFPSRVETDRLAAYHYEQARTSYNARAGLVTATLFSRCRDCRRRGEEFDLPRDVLGSRVNVADAEDDIASRGGFVMDPLSRHGSDDKPN
jgi:hypothetical protein